MNERLYLLKIELLNIEPAIWRRFVVPASITLDRLHYVIQMVMGWDDDHPYAFTIKRKTYMEDLEPEYDVLESSEYSLGDLVKRKRGIIYYLYDFGDKWDHKIVVEDSRYNDPELKSELVCHDGERACPPEDVGGDYGYYMYCQALENPDDESYQSYREWIRDDFDPGRFDIESVNRQLKEYNEWIQGKTKNWKGIAYRRF